MFQRFIFIRPMVKRFVIAAFSLVAASVATAQSPPEMRMYPRGNPDERSRQQPDWEFWPPWSSYEDRLWRSFKSRFRTTLLENTRRANDNFCSLGYFIVGLFALPARHSN